MANRSIQKKIKKLEQQIKKYSNNPKLQKRLKGKLAALKSK